MAGYQYVPSSGYFPQWVNSLALGKCGCNLALVIFKLISQYILSIPCEIVLRWMPVDLIDNLSTLGQVMAWCHQATSHYLIQCWPRFMGATSGQMGSMMPYQGRIQDLKLGVAQKQNWLENFENRGGGGLHISDAIIIIHYIYIYQSRYTSNTFTILSPLIQYCIRKIGFENFLGGARARCAPL